MPNVEPLRDGDPAAVGPYRLVGRLGAGGHGVVYLGQARNGTPVAVKVLREGLAGGDRLAAAIAAARKVEPFCLARVLDGSAGGRPYVVSEYVEGRSLQQAGPLGGVELQRLTVATATALDAIHQAGVLHLDFKPANVLIGSDGARVVDFGIAGAFGPRMSATGNIVGTPAYMAPEQLAGKAAQAPADVFAWASVVVFAATGVPPFGDDSLPAVINRILRDEPRIDDLPRPLRDVVAACLTKEPAGRPAMRDVLLRLIGGEGPDRPRRHPARTPDDDYATPAAERSAPAARPGAVHASGQHPARPAHHGAAHDAGPRTAPASRADSAHSGRASQHDAAAAPHHGADRRQPSASHRGRVPLAAPVDPPLAAAGLLTTAGHPGAAQHTAGGYAENGDTAETRYAGADGPPAAGETQPGALVQHSTLVDILVAGQPGGGGKARKRSGRRRVKTVIIALVSGVSVLALAAAIVWLTPTTPTSKADTVTSTTGTPSAETTPAAVTGRLRVASLRAGGTRDGDCWAGGQVTLQALVARTGDPLTFRYAWLIDGTAVARSSAVISENGQRYLTSPRNLTGTAGGTHRVTLRITSPVLIQRSISVTLCDDV
ncbi:protein kinase [Nonomuraea sp. NBC_00507]|uniref:serine/threonine protein kinase n=1 Tax=Nonomuraea sp. NBC_00507 TaxID=2976002 RepID=UPI002E197902